MKNFKSKRYHIISTVLVLIIAIALLAACAQAPAPAPAPKPAAPAAPAQPAPAPAPKPAATPAPTAKAKMYTFSGGTIGGSSNLYANILAAIGKKYLNVESTVIINPSMAQTHVVAEKQADVSTTPGFLPKQAYDGVGPFKDMGPQKDIRTLMVNQSAIVQGFVLARSDLVNYRDLEGKRIGAGKAGFHSDWATHLVLEVLGVTPASWTATGHEESAAAMVLGKMDAYFASGAPPHPTLSQTDLTNPVRLLTFSVEELALVKAKTSFQPYIVKTGAYRGMTEDAQIIEDPWCYVTRTDLPEDIAYGLTKAYFENPDFVGTIYSAAKREIVEGRMENWTKTVVTAPYHVGSLKYFKEKGWTVPAAMIPPEAK